MPLRRSCVILVATLALFATTAHANKAAVREEAVRRELSARADAWDKAIVSKNKPAIEENMAADFTQIAEDGRVATREAFLAGITDANLVLDPYVVEDFGVRVYGDAALVTGRIHMSGASAGKRFESHFRYIDTYVKRDGAWKVVSVQLTPMAP